jgi:tetratricopeptide (TPR) repeat protein
LLAEKYNPRNAEVQAALGHTYHLKKAYAQAEEHYLRALDLDENNPRYLNNLAAVYLDTGRYDEAIRFYREAAANLLFTSPETSYGGIGYVNFLKGDYVAAIAAYQEALARNPRYALGYFRLSEALFAVGRDEEAVRALKQTLGLVPNDVAVHYRLGLAYFKLRQKDKAAAAFRDVVRIAPDSEQARLANNYLEMLK